MTPVERTFRVIPAVAGFARRQENGSIAIRESDGTLVVVARQLVEAEHLD
jgi:hypothetical protein